MIYFSFYKELLPVHTAVSILVEALEDFLHLVPVHLGVLSILHLVNFHNELVQLQLCHGPALVLVDVSEDLLGERIFGKKYFWFSS